MRYNQLLTEHAKSKRRAFATYLGGALLAAAGTVGAMLQGVDWNVVFSPEAAAVAGASIVLLRAVVVLAQKGHKDAQ